MQTDSLEQHRRELDATFEALRAVHEHAHTAAGLDLVVWAAVDELRAELRALSNRVEALTRAAGVGNDAHSVRAGSSFYPSFCRVCGHSWESADYPDACPERDPQDGDVVVGPFTSVVSS